MTHLIYDYTEAIYNGDCRHAQEVLEELGVTYQHSTPQSLGDQWWFWNCENLPEELPSAITQLKSNPMDFIGFGLSQEDAERIRDYNKKTIKEQKCQ